MVDEEHYRKLERMYLSAPINRFYEPDITVSDGRCVITMPMQKKFYHAAHAAHGAIYFKMLDDAAFFAANSQSADCFFLTSHFSIHLVRPVSTGRLTSTGSLRFASQNLYIAQATLVNEEGKEIAFGTGHFVRSKVSLDASIGYA